RRRQARRDGAAACIGTAPMDGGVGRGIGLDLEAVAGRADLQLRLAPAREERPRAAGLRLGAALHGGMAASRLRASRAAAQPSSAAWPRAPAWRGASVTPPTPARSGVPAPAGEAASS